ncbi:MAG: cache domain-containing protein, partial [Thermodesulfobacteriota bacterium]|nr:cache domain-containing protein [Thermodesulfobacteriota bacterium]
MMKIRGKFIFPIAGLVILSVLIAVVSVNMTVSHLVEEQEKFTLDYVQDVLSANAKTRQESIYSSIDMLGQSALKQAALFSELPDVQDAYYLALTGDLNDEADIAMQQARQKLRLVMSSYVDGLTKQAGLKEFKIHFHTTSGRSLARIWRKGWQAKRDGKKVDISDDLTSFRQTVIEINQGDHKPLSGIEIGRGGFALRGLSPIVGVDGEHMGSCEVLLSFGDVLKANHGTNVDYELAVYLLSELLPIATKLQDPKKNPVLDGKYVFTSSTNPELTNSLITSAILDAGRNESSQQVVGNQYVSTFPVLDFSGKVVGVAALAYDMSKIEALALHIAAAGSKTMSAVNWRFGLGGAVLVLIVIAVLFIIVRPISNGLKNVSEFLLRVAEKGDLSDSLDVKFSQQKDEIGELSRAAGLVLNDYRMVEGLAKQLAEGNLASEIKIKSPQDFLGQALVQMLKQINEILSDVDRATVQIDAGSQQVSDTAQSLSQGATESAASLEEISSSMNEIGSQT